MFHGWPAVEPVRGFTRRGRQVWRVTRGFSYEHGPSYDDTVDVPEGFCHDFASTPRIFWRLFPPCTGPWAVPAIIHDYLYSTRTGSRADADDIFLQAMQEVGVPLWKRWAMHKAVRLAGSRAWKS